MAEFNHLFAGVCVPPLEAVGVHGNLLILTCSEMKTKKRKITYYGKKIIQKHPSGIHLGCIGASRFPPLPPHRLCRVLGWPGQEPPGAVPLCSCPRAPAQPLCWERRCRPTSARAEAGELSLAGVSVLRGLLFPSFC